MANGYGKSKYGNQSSSRMWKTFKIVEGSNIYRILPAMKSLADAGIWAKYYRVHWGYQGLDFKDKTKTRQKPFMCVAEKNRDGMVTKRCAECEEIERYENLLKEREQIILADLQTKGITDKDTVEQKVKEGTEELRDWLKTHSPDSKWYMNVMNPQGEFGVLLISHKTKKLLEVKIEKLINEDNVDPLDPDTGVWFNFARTGQKIAAQDSVEVVQDYVDIGNGKKAFVYRSGALTEAQLEDGLKQCPDLTEVVRKITADQISLLVRSSGDPEEVDSILGMSSKVPERVVLAGGEQTEKRVETPKAPVTQSPDQAALLAQIAALQAQLGMQSQKTPAPAQETVTDTTPVTTSAPIQPQSESKPEVTPTAPLPLDMDKLKNMTPQQFLEQFKLAQGQKAAQP